MKRLPAPFSLESLINSLLRNKRVVPKIIMKKFKEFSITKTLEDKLKPENKDSTFTWEQINDALKES